MAVSSRPFRSSVPWLVSAPAACGLVMVISLLLARAGVSLVSVRVVPALHLFQQAGAGQAAKGLALALSIREQGMRGRGCARGDGGRLGKGGNDARGHEAVQPGT